MANPPPQSPTNPHFFQPLLPGSDTHLTIPVAFFSKYIEGKNEQKSAKLRSDASDNTWEVKIDGRRFTGGWEDFATAHDLRIGDIIIFKHEGDMVFSVTPFGPSCCEIQYAQSHITKEEEVDNSHDDDDDNEKQHEIRKKLKTKNLKPETEPKSSFSLDYCFIAEVTASNLKVDTLVSNTEKWKYYSKPGASSSPSQNRFVTLTITPYAVRSNKMRLPLRFTRVNGIKKVGKITLLGQDGVNRKVHLAKENRRGSMRLGRDWKGFCEAHGVKIGESFVLELIRDKNASPVLKFSTKINCV